jgi:O-antigen/teichoic acid export membrane protein
MRARELVGGAHRIAGAATSQGLSSLSNVVIIAAIGRGGGASGLGRFTLAFSAYLITLSLCRALVSQPVLTLRGKLGAGDSRLNASVTAVGSLAFAAGLLSIGVGIGLHRAEFIAAGLLMAPLCVQDLLRFAFFQTNRPWGAALLDAIWLLASLASFPIILWRGSPVVAMVLWGVGALVSAVAGLVILRVRFTSPLLAHRWWRQEARHLGTGLVLESLAYSLGSQASLWVIAVILGGSDLGLLKGAQTVVGPAMMVLAGFTMVTVPRVAQSPQSQSLGSTWAISGRALLLVAGTSGVLVGAGPLVVRILFGSSLDVSQSLLLPTAVQFCVNALATGPVILLMVRQRGGALAAARAASMAVAVAAVAGASRSFGIVGAAWALASSYLVFAVGTGLAAAVLARRPEAPSSAGAAGPLQPIIRGLAALETPLGLHPPEIERWRPLVERYWSVATREPVDYCLQVMWAQSRGIPDAVNAESGGSGLYQHPASSWPQWLEQGRRWWAALGLPLPAGNSVFDPELNIAVAAWLWTTAGWQAWSETDRWPRRQWTQQVRWLGDGYGKQ